MVDTRNALAGALLGDLESADAQLRCRAVASLAKVPTLDVARALAKALDDPEPFVRWGAAEALGEVARRATDLAVSVAVGQAILAAARAPEPGTRAAAADAIAAWGAQGPLEPLLWLIQDAQPWVRAAAVRALGLAGHQAPQVVVPMIQRALEDPDAEVRRMAASASAWCRDGSAPSALQSSLGDSAATVRAAALRSLAKVTAGEHEQAVIACLSDPDPAVRVEAIRFLRQWGTQESIEPLAALEADTTAVCAATVGTLAGEARQHIARRLQRWRGLLLRWRERWERRRR